MLRVTLPDQSWIDDLGPVAGIEQLVWVPADGPRPDLEADAVVMPLLCPRSFVEATRAMPTVRLVQLLSAGYDGIPDAVAPGVAVANAAGVHDASTAELAVGLAVASLRGIPEAERASLDGRWATELVGRRSLADRRVLILGYGSVGRAIAARLAPFEVDLVAVASRPRAGDDLVDTVHGLAELDDLLPTAEVVIVIVPLTEATTGLVDAAFLAKLPEGALVVNVARGPVAVTDAILAEAGRLRFALDVTDPEPLPDGHPLFGHPDILVMPHIGGGTTAARPRAVRFLREQLTGLGAGRAPRNVVNEAHDDVEIG